MQTSQAMAPSLRLGGISPEQRDIYSLEDEIAQAQKSAQADVAACDDRPASQSPIRNSPSRSKPERQPNIRPGSQTPDGIHSPVAVLAPPSGTDPRELPEEAMVRENKALRRQLEAAWELCGLLRSHTKADQPKAPAASPSTLNGISELRQLRSELKDLCGVLRSHVQEPTSQEPPGAASPGHAASASALLQQMLLKDGGHLSSPRSQPVSPNVPPPGIPPGATQPTVIRHGSSTVRAADSSADGARSLSPTRAMSPGPLMCLATPVLQSTTPVVPPASSLMAQPSVNANVPLTLDNRGRPVPVAWGAPLIVRRPL